jgi:hypothetical protein
MPPTRPCLRRLAFDSVEQSGKKKRSNKIFQESAMKFKWLVAFILVLAGGIGYAQVTSGSISGSVTDPQGAVIPKAQIKLDEVSVGIHREVVSTNLGTFVVPNLPAGKYRLTVYAPGFETLIQDNLILTTGGSLGLGNVSMAIGTEQTTVTVNAEASQLQIQRDSGERSDVITNRQINDIAMNGRNVFDLMRIIPGINATPNNQDSSKGGLGQFNVNGTRSNQSNFTVDGMTNVDTGGNSSSQVTINPDAVSEMKILTSNYQAQYGKAGGAQIAVTTQGGTNQFHGDARYFFRDKGLNANSFFNNAQGLNANGTPVAPRQQYHYNYFGYQVGGPVKRNRIYSFFSQEYYRQLLPSGTNTVQLPTPAELNGDFSNSHDGYGNNLIITDPTNLQPFPGNVIPQDRINATIQTILKKTLPTPNISGVNSYNYFVQASGSHPRREDIGRIDWQVNPRNRLYVRGINNADNQDLPFGGGGVWGVSNFKQPGGFSEQQPGYNIVGNLTTTLTPSLINEFVAGWSVNKLDVNSNGGVSKAAIGASLPLVFPQSDSTSVPDFSFGGISNQTLPYTYNGAVPYTNSAVLVDINDSVTKIYGQHTLKAGFFFERSRKDQIAYGNSNGSFVFWGQDNSHPALQTNDPFSNALLGDYNNFTQTNNRRNGQYRFTNAEGYLQDTWRVNAHLVFDYGVRFTYYQPQYEKNGFFQNFVPATYSAAQAVRLYHQAPNGSAYDPANPGAFLPSSYIGTIVPNSGSLGNGIETSAQGYPIGAINDRGAMYEPRLGLAYSVSNTVVRGGFGISHDRYEGVPLYDLAVNNPPAVLSPAYTYGHVEDLPSLANSGTYSPQSIDAFAPTGKVPTIYSYSLGLQQTLGKSSLLDMAYVGNRSTHLSQQVNLNYIPYGTTFTQAAQDPGKYPGGIVPSVEPNLPAIYSAAGYNYSGKYAFDSEFLRRYQGYNDIAYHDFVGVANYNSLQVSVQHRYGQSLTFGAVYTWSKTMATSSGDGDYVSPYGRAYTYSPSGFDRRHIAAFNYTYHLPGVAKYLHEKHWMSFVTDGYELSGIVQFMSGTPTAASLNIPNSGQRISGSYTESANLYLNGNPSHRYQTSLVNPTVFVLPPIGFQPAPPLAYLRQPGLENWDCSLFKNISLGEASRYLQLRLEAFNILNHTNYSALNLGTQVATATGATDVDSIVANYGSSIVVNPSLLNNAPDPRGLYFGHYNGQWSGTGGPRVVQLAAKLYF